MSVHEAVAATRAIRKRKELHDRYTAIFDRNIVALRAESITVAPLNLDGFLRDHDRRKGRDG